jgi:hypothetical protein
MEYRYHAELYELFPCHHRDRIRCAHKNELRVGFKSKTISSKFDVPISFPNLLFISHKCLQCRGKNDSNCNRSVTCGKGCETDWYGHVIASEAKSRGTRDNDRASPA